MIANQFSRLPLLAAMAAIGAAAEAATPVFINEIHYDNAGSDSGEAVEIAGPAGTNLSGWKIVPYNGNGGASYTPVCNLSGSIPNQNNGFGSVSCAISGLQNGAPDGIALVDAGNAVVQFLSYEGSFSATNGPANGMASVDIGVSQSGSGAVGQSLQLPHPCGSPSKRKYRGRRAATRLQNTRRDSDTKSPYPKMLLS